MRKIYKSLLLLVVLVVAISMLVACGGGGDTPKKPESVTLSQTSITIERGGNASLTATVSPSDADKTVTWTSSNTSVATVSNGVVKGVSIGQATITAVTKNGKYATCEVTVTIPSSEVIPVQGVIVWPSVRVFDEIGATYTLNATVTPNNSTYRAITWSSTDESVVTVTEDGVITVVGYGKAEVRANAHGGVYGVCRVNVKTPILVTFMLDGEMVGETYTYAEDGGLINIPTQTEPTQADKSWLNIADITTIPTSTSYVENWYFDEDFTTPYVEGMDVSDSPVLYGKVGYAYGYDVISGSDGNYVKINEFYPSFARTVQIPATIGGHPVTVIGEGAFENANISAVIVPQSVVTINDDAFRDSTRLESVRFASGSLLTHVGDSAFRGCVSLGQVAFPDTLMYLGELALYGTDNDKATQLSSKGTGFKKYYTPKYVFEFLGQDVMPIATYGEIPSNQRVVDGQIAHAPAGVCDPVYGVGLETALREFVDSGCNLMAAHTLVNAIQGQDPNVERSYAHYMKLLEEYGGMMLYRDMSLRSLLYEEYAGPASGFDKYPELTMPTANATFNSYINSLYPKFASFAGVFVADEPGWVDWIEEYEEPYTFNQRVGNDANSALSLDANGNPIPKTLKRGRMDDGLKAWRDYMPDRLFMVNLLQTYAPKWALPNGYYGYNDGGQLDGVPNFTGDSAPLPDEIDYEYYYRTYIENVKPQLFSFDYYPCMGDGTSLANTYFEQLSYANYYASEYYKEYHGTETGIPWWPCIQTLGWNGYRPGVGVTQAELGWQINTAFAYGAKGYTYFTYASIQKNSVGSAIDYYGNKTDMYSKIKTVNEYAQAQAKWLLNAEMDHLTQVGSNPNSYNVNTGRQGLVEQTPARMFVAKDKNMVWRLTSSSGTPHLVSHMKYYANNNNYVEGVEGDVRELYFVCNNTITENGLTTLNFSGNVSGKIICRGLETRFENANQLKLNLHAGESAAILLDK